MTTLSSSEWEALQAQLVSLKGELYEAREREQRALRAAATAAAAAEAAKQKAAAASEPNAEDAAAATGGRSRGVSTDDGSHGASKLSSIMSSVKRNSQSLGQAIAAAAHATTAAAGVSGGAPAAPAEHMQSELSALRQQHASELEEAAEQTAALKLNMAHLHKKAQDLEKQNATLMTHLSNLEEERHSLAEKRERELKRRKAREEARKQRLAAGEPAPAEGEDDDDDDDDLEAARAKWDAKRTALETQLSIAQSDLAQRTADLAQRDEQVAKLKQRVADEEKNFERILAKMADKDQELMQLRDELHAKQKQLRASPASSPSPAPQQPRDVTSPLKSPSALRSFFNKGKDLVASPPPPAGASAAAQPATSPQTSSAAAPVASPKQDAAQPDGVALPAAAADANAAGSSSVTVSAVSESLADHSGASQPVDAQVSSLQEELSSLRVLNEHLLSSVQKKDTLLTKEREEAERILQKLAEKEVQLMQLREAQSSVEDVQREVKKRDAEIKRLREQLAAASAAQSDAVSKAVQSSTVAAELRAASESLSVMQSEYESLKDALENTKDQLFLAETQLIDKQKLLNEQAEQLKELRASADGHEATIHSLMAAKAKGEREMNEHVDYLERKCISEITEWERKYDTDMADAQAQRDTMQAQLRDARREMAEARAEETAVRGELIALRAEHDALVASERELSASCEKLNRELSELRANSGIETRKRNRLVQELKTALRAELLRAKDALARLKNAEDDLVTLKVMQQHKIAPTGSFALTVDPATESGAGGDGSSDPNSTRSSLHPPLQSSGSSSSLTPSHSKGVEQEVANALAQKLAQLENDKFLLAKKQRALEEHNDMLQADVMQKKEMIRNLVRRIEIGSLTTSGDDSGMKQMATLSPEARQVLFEKMEVLLQETTLQNAQYKNNLQSMGQEITKLMEELDEKSAEVVSVREDLDALKDEEELARQSAADSLELMRSTEQQMRKIERALVAIALKLEQEGTLEKHISALEAELQTLLRQCMQNARGGGAVRRLSNSSPAEAAPTATAVAATPAKAASSPKSAAAAPSSSSDAGGSSSGASSTSAPASKKARRAAAKAKEEAEQRERDAAQRAEEDARIERMQAEAQASATGETPADESTDAEQRRKQIDAERAQAAAEEEARRESLLAEADALSADLLSPASLRSPHPPRSSSALLRDVESEPPSAVTSLAAAGADD